MALVDDPERITLVLEVAGELAGYAAAEIQPDGEGYLDYLAIAPGHRGRGHSKTLLASIGRRVLAASSAGSDSQQPHLARQGGAVKLPRTLLNQ